MKDFNFKIPQNIQFGMGSLKKAAGDPGREPL